MQRYDVEIVADWTNGSQMGQAGNVESYEERRARWSKMTRDELIKKAKTKYGLCLEGTKDEIVELILQQTRG